MPFYEPPPIEGDASSIILDIFTHESLMSTLPHEGPNLEYGTPERLADLGRSALQLAITYYYFSRDRLATGEAIREKREQFFDDDSIMKVAQSYGFRDRIRAHPGRPDVRESPQEMRKLINKYAGALFIRNGLDSLRAWVQQIIEPEAEQIQPMQTDPPSYDHGWQRSPPQPPTMPPPPLPTGRPYPPAPPAPGLGIPSLALVNQTAMQRGYHLTYSASQTGPAHLPTWTVTCLVNGVERGRGTGRNQKVAKEDAARQAWENMGWGGES
ncbi:hypothetical protein AX16_000334 [Volvariella volvacea WC 439]|nr:hypothetical protein AX16_000334 [Volvariella volvacea WC 439]